MTQPRDEKLDKLSAEIHKVYCSYYESRYGKPYWTNGDYSLLDEETKEADRYMARFISSRTPGLVPLNMVEVKDLVALKLSQILIKDEPDRLNIRPSDVIGEAICQKFGVPKKEPPHEQL